ncbi:hypothetical protein BGW80DRAFT_1282954 [Lactifluus volemus]|nr:hypothetical protein BGW80DRAFT_1282954 [Lactifluus volemus]
MVLLFVRLKTPPATLREKLSKMDFIGNILIIGSVTSLVIERTLTSTDESEESKGVDEESGGRA